MPCLQRGRQSQQALRSLRRNPRGKWTKMDENGRKWTKMDENGRKWTKMDENGWKWTKMDEKWWTDSCVTKSSMNCVGKTTRIDYAWSAMLPRFVQRYNSSYIGTFYARHPAGKQIKDIKGTEHPSSRKGYPPDILPGLVNSHSHWKWPSRNSGWTHQKMVDLSIAMGQFTRHTTSKSLWIGQETLQMQVRAAGTHPHGDGSQSEITFFNAQLCQTNITRNQVGTKIHEK